MVVRDPTNPRATAYKICARITIQQERRLVVVQPSNPISVACMQGKMWMCDCTDLEPARASDHVRQGAVGRAGRLLMMIYAAPLKQSVVPDAEKRRGHVALKGWEGGMRFCLLPGPSAGSVVGRRCPAPSLARRGARRTPARGGSRWRGLCFGVCV